MDCNEILNCHKYDPITNKPNLECIKRVIEQLEECKDHQNLSDKYLLKYGINSRKFK